MKRISYKTAKLAAKAGYNEPNEVYYCLDQNNNPKIECIIPDEPGIQNSDFEDLYTVPYTYELIDWLRNTHKIYISIFPVTWFQLSVNIYKIEENQVKEIFAQFCVTVNSDTDYNRFIDTILQHILTNIIYETETSKSSL